LFIIFEFLFEGNSEALHLFLSSGTKTLWNVFFVEFGNEMIGLLLSHEHR
jgi:hypothetical protein